MPISNHVVSAAPGAVGKLTNYILESSYKPQPALALGAALALVGVLKAHRVQTETGLRTNLLIANIAPSGAGKNAPLQVCKKLLAEMKLDNLITGKPASDVGLIHSLSQNNGMGIIFWDELGHALKAFATPQQAHYQREIVGTMCELFTCADSSYTGKSYSEGALRKTVHLEQPHLCVLGCSTPDRLYECLSSSFVEDGFIPRWLFVEPEATDPGANRRPCLEIPKEITDLVRSIHSQPTYDGPRKGDLSDVMFIKPKVVRLLTAALPWHDVIADFYSLRLAQHKNELIRAIYARGMEHSMKVALTVAEPTGIAADDLAWSFRLVSDCLDGIVARLEKYSASTRIESDLKKVRDIIMAAGAISRNELTRKTQWLSGPQRADIIETLLASLQITMYVQQVGRACKPTVFYKTEIQ